MALNSFSYFVSSATSILKRVLIIILFLKANAAFAQNSPGSSATGATSPSAIGPAAITAENVDSVLKEKSSQLLFDAESTKKIVENLTAPYEYKDQGRKDPFSRPEVLKAPDALPFHGPFLSIQAYKVEDFKVKAIVWSVNKPSALLQTPDGKVYSLGLGQRIGNRNGYIAVIREGEVVVVETQDHGGKEMASTRILPMTK